MNRGMKLACTAATMALILNACGGGGTGSTAANATGTPAVSGILTDSPVKGAKYICGNVTSTTGTDGHFACDAMPVSFYVGNVKLGELQQLPDDGYVTPQDLAGVERDDYSDNVAKIAMFLQSLDDDGEIEAAITLDNALIEKLKDKHADLQHMSDTELVELLDQINVDTVVPKDEALEHLYTHMMNLPLSHNGEGHTSPHNTHNDHHTPTVPAVTTDTNTSKPGNTVKPAVDNNGTAPVLDNALKQAYLDAVNEARAEGRECGKYGHMPAADPVTWNSKLYKAAYEHSKDMAVSNTFSHTGSGTSSDVTAEEAHTGHGSGVGERIEHNGYTNWHQYGENIAAGTVMDDVSEAMEGWLKSPGHCKNIMKKEFKEVGVAVYYHENSHYKYYWTQDFGAK